ncbi:MAG: glycerophosphodiester phosphodiesterase family protein [Clostridia bacterium]
MWGFCIMIFALAGCWLFFVAPGRSEKHQRAPFEHRTFAHRGLYAKDQCIPENSLPAFDAAVQANYGIELDIQLTKDRQVVVFHDENLLRMCGVDARVDAFTYAELCSLQLCNSGHRIPLFSDVLSIINGRVPLIIELKPGGAWQENCALALTLLRTYRGAYCVESFHPRMVLWFRKHAPDILRGQLSEAYRFSNGTIPWYQSLLMSRVLTNVITRPQFLAYRIGPKCLSARTTEWLGAMRISWTAHPDDDWNQLKTISDCIIFEHMRPEKFFGNPKSPLAEAIDQIDQEIKKKQQAYVTATNKPQ